MVYSKVYKYALAFMVLGLSCFAAATFSAAAIEGYCRNRIFLDQFSVQAPKEIDKIVVGKGEYQRGSRLQIHEDRADIYIKGKKAGGIFLYLDGSRNENDILPAPYDSVPEENRKVKATEESVTVRLTYRRSTGEIENHIFVINKRNYQIVDYYEIMGVAPENTAEYMLSGYSPTLNLPQKFNPIWKVRELDRNAAFREQVEALNGRNAWKLDPEESAKYFIPQQYGVKKQNLRVDYKNVVIDPSAKRVSSAQFIILDNEDNCYRVNLFQVFIQGSRGAWVPLWYHEMKQEPATSPGGLTLMTLEEVKKTAPYIVYEKGKDTVSGNKEILDAFIERMNTGVPSTIDFYEFDVTGGKEKLTSWFRLICDGERTVSYKCIKNVDGKYRCYWGFEIEQVRCIVYEETYYRVENITINDGYQAFRTYTYFGTD